MGVIKLGIRIPNHSNHHGKAGAHSSGAGRNVPGNAGLPEKKTAHAGRKLSAAKRGVSSGKRLPRRKRASGQQSLSWKLAFSIGLLTLVMFFVIWLLVSFLFASALLRNESTNLSDVSLNNVEKLNNVLSKNQVMADAMNLAAQGVYDQSKKEIAIGLSSEVTYDRLSASCSKAESSFLNMCRTAINSSDAIVGAGVFFEPYQFAGNIPVYSPYMNRSDVKKCVVKNIQYDGYKDLAYYQTAKETLKSGYSAPYENRDGAEVVTAYYPIVSKEDGMFKGVIAFDVTTDLFSSIAYMDPQYPSLYTNVINPEGTILYSTHTNVIGKPFSETVSEKAYKAISAKWAEGKAFQISTDSSSGKVERFYAPLYVNGANWWVQTAVPYGEYVASIVKIVAALGVVLLIVLFILISIIFRRVRGSLKPLQSISSVANKMAQGDFNVEISHVSNDEIGVMAGSMQSMTDRLKSIIRDLTSILNQVADGDFAASTLQEDSYIGEYRPLLNAINTITDKLDTTMREIKNSADRVNNSANAVANGSQSLAQGATEQASSVEELSATMNEISYKIRETADKASAARDLAGEAGRAVGKSNAKMAEMSRAMAEITAKSSEISKIIKTIDDIAFQTNILSLNASIEAARAGEAGKGFAVVADEVGNLASKSQQAAQSTAELIQDTVDAVDRGARITQETAEALNNVAANANKISAIISEISNASDEQAAGVSQVTTGLTQISSVVQTNSSTAEKSAAASEQLTEQSDAMTGLINHFHLKDTR